MSAVRPLVFAVALLSAPAAFAHPVSLRGQIESAGTAVTLGDIFDDAGPVAARAIGPAPGAGRTATFSARFISAAASAAGLEWTPPAGMDRITVTGSANAATASAARVQPASASGDIAVRRGEIVTLVYTAPGMQLTTRARATGDASVGDTVQLVNMQSNRTVEAQVTGVATASASAGR